MVKPEGAVLRRRDYFIAPISQATALELVREHHYSGGGSNTAVYRHGLFHVDDPDIPLGVAWWLPPTKKAGQSVVMADRSRVWSDYAERWRNVLSLTRLVVVPEVPTNGASFLMAASIRMVALDERWSHLVTYADEGQGHSGAIYLATNWSRLESRRGGPVWKDADGRHHSLKNGPTSRTKADMLALGYVSSGPTTKRKFVRYLDSERSAA